MKKLAWLVFMIGPFAAGQTVTVTASHLQNASGQLISGYIYLQPTLTSGQPTWYRTPGGGTVSSAAVPVAVTNGVLSVTLPDTTQTYPANLCFTMTYPQGSLATGYNCLQPHTTAYNASDWCQAGVCNLDNYLPGNQPLPTINAVSSINYTAGNLTFTGSGFSQSGDTFTFNGGSVQSLTTTGTSGASTLASGVLNIPQYAGSGANSNITSLTGLTTPLSITQGGTGQNSLVPTTPVTTAPSGSCAQGAPNQQDTLTGQQYSCQNVVSGVGTWGTYYPGVSSDGANGLTVTGNVGAGTFSIPGAPSGSYLLAQGGYGIPSGSGNMSDGSGSTTAGQVALTTATAHLVQYLSQKQDWRIAGPVSTGLTDQAANVTNAWNAIAAANGAGWMPTGTVTLGSSVSPTSGLGEYSELGINGGGGGQLGEGTVFNWTGGASPAFALDRQRDSIIGNFIVNLNSVSGASGIDLSQLSTTGGGISTNDTFSHINVQNLSGSGAIGFEVGSPSNDSQANEEGMTFWRTGCITQSYATGTTCFQVDSSPNRRSEAYYESGTSGTGTAYSMNSDSEHIIGGLTEQHNLVLDSSSGPSTELAMLFNHDEGSKQGVIAQNNLILMGNSYEMDSPNTAVPWWDFSSGTQINPFEITIGNNFRSNVAGETILKTGLGSYISIGDDLDGASLPFDNFRSIILGTSNTASGADLSIFRYNTTDGISSAGNSGGILLGSGVSYPGNFNYSPPFTIAGSVDTGAGVTSSLPYTFQVIPAGAASTGYYYTTLTLQPPVDLISNQALTYPLNFDFSTNAQGGYFHINNLIADGTPFIIGSVGGGFATSASPGPPYSITLDQPVGGTIPAGSYYVKIVTLGSGGTHSAPSVEAGPFTLASTGGFEFQLQGYTATLGQPYQLWIGTTSGAENYYTNFVDSSTSTVQLVTITSLGTSGTMPTTDTANGSVSAAGSLNSNAAQTTVTGTTAGSAVWSQPQQGTALKVSVIYLNGYENTTATAQMITLPASYSAVGYVVTDGGSCTGVTISGATVTLPSGMGATQTGLCEVRGY